MRKPVPHLLSGHDAFTFGTEEAGKGEVRALRAQASPLPHPPARRLRRHPDRRLRNMRSGGISRHGNTHQYNTGTGEKNQRVKENYGN
jgi:hypothetical protein